MLIPPLAGRNRVKGLSSALQVRIDSCHLAQACSMIAENMYCHRYCMRYWRYQICTTTSEMIPTHNVMHTTTMAMVTKNTTFDTVAACVKQVEAGMMRTYSSLLKSINV